MAPQPTAAIYARISRDDRGDEAGVGRQKLDCQALAQQLGYTVAHIFEDNDTGASARSRAARPAYADLLERARAGEFAAILAYSNSRLTRRPREFEDLLDLVRDHGVQIHTVASGSVDLSTADGQLIARVLANVDAAEADRTGERVQRAFLERARQGKSHGAVAYGWERDADGNEHIIPEQADVIREAAQRVIAGESMRAITKDLLARQVPTPKGGKWNGTILRQLLLRERNAGKRVHRGEVIGPGSWPSILTDAQQLQLTAILRDPSRRTARGTALRFMLSGIMLCGVCGETCRSLTGARYTKPDGTEGRRPTAYGCGSCFKTRRIAHKVDELVEAVVLARLRMPDAPALLAGDPEGARAAREDRDTLRARLDGAADEYAEGRITAAQLSRITAKLTKSIAAADELLTRAGISPELGFMATEDPGEAWERATVEQRRELIDLLMTVTLMPTGAGGGFNPESVKIEWKAGR
ncbi:recombinase family protein [Brachybacterium tyrofermentans]|uniref:recombinase family protein n=1 Tax=Brachybacterium tyrofermentans TaxID=47848 RepID=UPI003FCFA909